MRLKQLSKFTMLTASVMVALALAASSYKLAYHMQKGQRLNYVTSFSIDETTEMMGQEQNTRVNATAHLRVEVEDVDKAGNITFIHALDSLRLEVKNPQIDSTIRNPEELIGKRTRQVMNAHGKRLKNSIVDSMKLGAMMGQLTRLTALRMLDLPENELRIGDSWTTSTPDTSERPGGRMVVKVDITFTASAEVDTLGFNCLRIAYQGRTAVKGDWKQMGMNFFIEGEGPNSGTAYFALKEGVLVAQLADVQLENTIALTGQMNMTLPSSSSSKSTMVLIK
jgi:hypothetical protein